MPFIDVDIADAYETSALPGQGDVNAGGGGLTTSSMANESDLRAYGLDVQSKAARGGNGNSAGHRSKVSDSSGNIYDAGTGQHIGRAITPALSQNDQANHPLWTIVLIVGALFLWKFMAKEDHESEKLVKFSIMNTLRITLMAAIGILILKWIFSVYSIASISPTIEFL